MPKSRGSRRGNAQRRRKTLHGARRTQRRGLSPPVSHSHERTFPDISVYTHTDPGSRGGSVTYCHSNDVPLACLYIVCANGLHVPVRPCVRRVLLTRPTSIHNNSPPSLYCSAPVERAVVRLQYCPVEGLRGSLHMITIDVTHDCMIIACLLTCLLTCLFNYMHSSSQVPAVSCLLLPVDRTTADPSPRHHSPSEQGVRGLPPPGVLMKWFCLRAPNRERTCSYLGVYRYGRYGTGTSRNRHERCRSRGRRYNRRTLPQNTI